MAVIDSTDVIILSAVGILTTLYVFYKRSTSNRSSGAVVSKGASGGPSGSVKPGSAEVKSPSKFGKKSLSEKIASVSGDSCLVLFYGSQTGTAEDLALRFGKDVTSKYSVPALILDVEEYDMTELADGDALDETTNGKNILYGYFLATYGEGEPTDNATEFYEWIMSGKGKGADEGDEDGDDDELLENRPLEGIHKYIIFGLGNKTYEHFNAIARRLDKRLKAIGAKRVGELGEGDDDCSMEEDYAAWKKGALAAVAGHFGVEVGESGTKKDEPHVPTFKIIDVASSNGSDVEVFRGEYSAGKPRRWEKVKIGAEEYDVVDGGDGEKYVEISGAKVKHDAKHPHYGRIVTTKPLFTDVYDEFAFAPSVRLPVEVSNRFSINEKKIRIERHCLHVELDLSGSDLKYETGDHVGIWPVNDEEHLERYKKVLALSEEELDRVVTLKVNEENRLAANSKIPFPVPSTLRTVLLHYLDLTAILKQYQFEVLAKHATNPAERDALFQIAENRDIYLPFVEKSQKDLAQVLSHFPSVKIPLSVIIGELLPRISVRYYSISSSAKETPKTVGITAVMVRHAVASTFVPGKEGDETGEVVIRQGLATSWLQRLHEAKQQTTSRTNGVNGHTNGTVTTPTPSLPIPQFHLPLYIRTSSFRLPRNPRLPVIMVGPGTGVAPFRAFTRERFHIAAKQPQTAVGPTWLFYGCRHPDKDYLYKSEFEDMKTKVEAGDVKMELKVVDAFSRVPGEKKVYVQERLKEFAEDVWRMIGTQGAYFYVCGDAKHMAADVHAALEHIALTHGKLASAEKAKAWVKDLRSQGRYLEDVWS
ncbi:uncharacterized protein EV422DRAFT_534514 [Fimicolochytrium jonesii]|uniref:uncharacterized protein n=1 Tax=Fimicolochytrium jonesii TaxID=1396493 RepID=UPI0022FE5EE9|nr:uncharacterized protein EV422DRAFT_534514 [Fimicolochytrium jonesii]KAI8819375.1 hypothetical protein EV422DRAFT_534514 [Fimicolochytrium jonesii]